MTIAVPTPWATEVRPVTRREVRAFAYSIGATDPVHHEVDAARAAGYPDLVAPAYFFSSLGLSFGRLVPRERLGPEGLPLDDELSGQRVVAGETRVEWSGDIVAESTVVVRQRLAAITSKTGSRGPLLLYAYERTYSCEEELLVAEYFTRIAR